MLCQFRRRVCRSAIWPRAAKIVALALALLNLGEPTSAAAYCSSRPVHGGSIGAVIQHLATALEANHVSRVVVIYVSLDTLTQRSINPDDLLDIATNRWTVKPKSLPALAAALKQTRCGPRHYPDGDFRFGCIFYGADKRKLAYISVTEWGDLACINGVYFEISGDRDIYVWLRGFAASRAPSPMLSSLMRRK